MITKSCIEFCFSFRFVFEIIPKTSQASDFHSSTRSTHDFGYSHRYCRSEHIIVGREKEKERAKSGVEPPLAPPPLLRQNKCDKCGKTAQRNKNLQRHRQMRTAHLALPTLGTSAQTAKYKRNIATTQNLCQTDSLTFLSNVIF